jgi:hypothetical protein
MGSLTMEEGRITWCVITLFLQRAHFMYHIAVIWVFTTILVKEWRGGVWSVVKGWFIAASLARYVKSGQQVGLTFSSLLKGPC